MYDTDHPVGEGDSVTSVSNKGTAALSAASQTLAAASYGAARTAIMDFTDDEGRKLGLVPDTLEVPSALETTARLLVENEKLADDTPKPVQGHGASSGQHALDKFHGLVPARNHQAAQAVHFPGAQGPGLCPAD